MNETWVLQYLIGLQIHLRTYFSMFSVLLNKLQDIPIHLKHKSQDKCPLIYTFEITFLSYLLNQIWSLSLAVIEHSLYSHKATSIVFYSVNVIAAKASHILTISKQY